MGSSDIFAHSTSEVTWRSIITYRNSRNIPRRNPLEKRRVYSWKNYSSDGMKGICNIDHMLESSNLLVVANPILRQFNEFTKKKYWRIFLKFVIALVTFIFFLLEPVLQHFKLQEFIFTGEPSRNLPKLSLFCFCFSGVSSRDPSEIPPVVLSGIFIQKFWNFSNFWSF